MIAGVYFSVLFSFSLCSVRRPVRDGDGENTMRRFRPESRLRGRGRGSGAAGGTLEADPGGVDARLDANYTSR